MYALEGFATEKYGTIEDYGNHGRIRKFYGRPNIEEILAKEWAEKKGDAMVTGKPSRSGKKNSHLESMPVSAETAMRGRVRQHVSHPSTGFDYYELDFQPQRRAGFSSLRQQPVIHEGVV